jgi:hypothetical protein
MKMNEKIAEIKIDLYQVGLIARCEELELESLITTGDALMEFLNNVREVTDPDVTFQLTELGEEYAEFIKQRDNDKNLCREGQQ